MITGDTLLYLLIIRGNKTNKENIAIKTPSANVSIRGTDFTLTVNELGESLIILLPKDDGTPSGEILVATAAGEEVLNQPFQATTVSMFETEPSKPVILDITTQLIDNMLIVNPPKEEISLTETTTDTGSNNILDVDYLEFEDLDIDYLAQDDLEFNQLDINYLDVNYLEDLLNVLDALAIAIGMSGPSTLIIPGHGEVSVRSDVVEFRDMALIVAERVENLVLSGATFQDVLAANTTAEFEDKWGDPERFLRGVFAEVGGQ